MNLTPVQTRSPGDWPSLLIKADDRELEDLAHTEFSDAGDRFKLGAGDQAITAASFSYLFRRDPGSEALVVGVPRGANDVALCLALTNQFTQLSRITSPLAAMLSPWKGSIVVIGHNSGVQTRLGELQVRRAAMRGGVANALRAYRVRTDGRLSAPDGSVTDHTGGQGRLLYLNTRIQWPVLTEERDPLVIVDATRLGATANLQKALKWAATHNARHLIVVAHLGDTGTLEELERAGHAAWMFDLSRGACADLVHELGRPSGDSRLSCNELLLARTSSVRVREVAAPELNEHLLAGLSVLPDAPTGRDNWPYPVIQAHRLLSGCRRLIDDVTSYNQAAALDPWITTLGGASRTVERSAEFRPTPDRWRMFHTNHWGGVRHAALTAYELISAGNPKLEALIDEIDRALRDPDRTVVVRTADRLGANALPATLLARLGEEAMSRVVVARAGEVLQWLGAAAGPVTEILPGAPSSWDTTWLFTAESTDRVILTYPLETPWIERAARRTFHGLGRRRHAFFDRFNLGDPAPFDEQVELPAESPASAREAVVLKLPDLWERILELEAPTSTAEEVAEQVVRHGNRSLSPELSVRTDDGRVHLIPGDHEVEVFIAGRYRIRLGRELQAGDQMLYTTGSGRDSLFTRLVAASHRTMRVDDLDVVMRRFRTACRTIRTREGSWAAGNRKLRDAGAAASTQLQHWAEGNTIAPDEPGDVLIVATLAKDEALASNWFRIEALASELRRVHRNLGRCLSSAIAEALEGGGPNVRRVAEMVGVDGPEILDEFTAATIIEINRI